LNTGDAQKREGSGSERGLKLKNKIDLVQGTKNKRLSKASVSKVLNERISPAFGKNKTRREA